MDHPARQPHSESPPTHSPASTTTGCSHAVPTACERVHPDPLVQAAAGVGLEVIHHSLGASLRFHHDVNVVGPHVGGQQAPVALAASLQQGGQHRLSAASVHTIRRLIHPLSLGGNPLRIGFDHTAPGQIMPSIDGTRFIAVQVAAVASERDQVDHRNVVDSVSTAPYGRGSATMSHY